MKTKILGFFWFLLVTSWGSHASTDSMAETEAEVMAVETIEQLLVDVVASTVEARVGELNKALLAKPKETELFLRTAIEAGYKDPEVIVQCELGIDKRQVVGLIKVLQEKGTDLEPLILRCLPLVPAENLVEVVTNLLLEAGPAQLNDVIQLTLGVIEDGGIEPEVVLVNSLVDSGLLEVEDSGCVGDCLTPVAEQLVESLNPDFALDTDTDPGDEPSFSDS